MPFENPRVGGSILPQATKIKAKCDKHLAQQDRPATERAFLRPSEMHSACLNPPVLCRTADLRPPARRRDDGRGSRLAAQAASACGTPIPLENNAHAKLLINIEVPEATSLFSATAENKPQGRSKSS